jgi:hypothetical protein
MFHIFNKVYLEYDFSFKVREEFILASERWAERPMISVDDVIAPIHAPSFEELLTSEFNDSIEEFWTSLISKTKKFVVFLDPDTLTKLQVQYWISIFEDATTADIHKLYTSWVESRRLNGYFDRVGSWDRNSNAWTRPNVFTDLKFLSLAEIETLIADTSPVEALKSLDMNTVSFEYLLADYLADNTSPYKAELLERIKVLTWDNWLDELEHLKYEILSGTIDAGKLDTEINVSVGNIETELAKSNLLKWTVDPAFGDDIDYIRSTYDYTIFDPCWTELAKIWGYEYGDMSELNMLINNDRYDDLLARDIARNYGCSYTKDRFMNKCNQVFATYCYDLKRKTQTGQLSGFRLRR